MKNAFFSFAVFCLFAVNASAMDFPAAPAPAPTGGGNALLSAQKFPKTFGDLSFADRMAVLKEGFEPFASTFEDGVCVSGCAFPGMKLQDTIDFYNQQTAIATARADAIRAAPPPPPPVVAPEPIVAPPPPAVQPSAIVPNKTAPTEFPETGGTETTGTAFPHTPAQTVTPPQSYPQCPVPDPKRTAIKPSQTIPDGYPLNLPLDVNSPFGARSAPATKNGRVGSSFHYGMDLRAPIGTPVFSTLSGMVTFAGYNGDCGNMVRVVGRDGFGVGFCHLSEIKVHKGDAVAGGCIVALSGNTGNSGGPHLHYIVYNNGTMVNPDSFIKK
ncbi:MAG: M23 family metallopeptidase [Proteobacteria bacterium]|nr:M23 family metallopeptidase [Pseudomonadota bacterium]